MKKLMMMAFVALALVACKNDKAKVDNSAELQRDSLNQIIAQRDAEINDMMATLNEIENGFKEINAAAYECRKKFIYKRHYKICRWKKYF